MQTLKKNSYSHVWLEGEWVYKQQPKFLAHNEIWCLTAMFPTGFVPEVERVHIELIRTRYIEPQVVTNAAEFMGYLEPVLDALENVGIRHGDLTRYAIIVNDNRPWLIDFAESRLLNDPRPDKRPEGDRYWLTKTMQMLAEGR